MEAATELACGRVTGGWRSARQRSGSAVLCACCSFSHQPVNFGGALPAAKVEVAASTCKTLPPRPCATTTSGYDMTHSKTTAFQHQAPTPAPRPITVDGRALFTRNNRPGGEQVLNRARAAAGARAARPSAPSAVATPPQKTRQPQKGPRSSRRIRAEGRARGATDRNVLCVGLNTPTTRHTRAPPAGAAPRAGPPARARACAGGLRPRATRRVANAPPGLVVMQVGLSCLWVCASASPRQWPCALGCAHAKRRCICEAQVCIWAKQGRARHKRRGPKVQLSRVLGIRGLD